MSFTISNHLKRSLFAERRSLRQQIIQPVILASFVIALCVFFFQHSFEQRQAKEKIQEEVVSLARFLQLTSASYVESANLPVLQSFSDQANSNVHIHEITFFSLDGRPLTKTKASSDKTAMKEFIKDVKNQQGAKVGSMRILYSESAETAIMSRSMGYALSGYAVMLCFVIFMIWFVSQRVVGPFSTVGKLLLELSSDSEANARRLNASATSLSSSANQQSAAVQETLSSITQMRTMMEQTIGNITRANDLGNQIRNKSVSGTETMNEMERAMSDIRETTSDLGQMVGIIHGMSEKTKVIHDIVFKTQLLAFNASIEAARAGQHGKGFAVVADEVRDLSNLAGSAANDIENMILETRRSVEKVVEIVTDRISQGEHISKKAHTSFQGIAEDIKKISGSIGDIFAATQDQHTGIAQTMGSMDQLNNAAHNNAVASGEIVVLANKVGRSSQLLKNSSDRLMSLVHGRQHAFTPKANQQSTQQPAKQPPSTQTTDATAQAVNLATSQPETQAPISSATLTSLLLRSDRPTNSPRTTEVRANASKNNRVVELTRQLSLKSESKNNFNRSSQDKKKKDSSNA